MSIVNLSGGAAAATMPTVTHSGTISSDETWAANTIHDIEADLSILNAVVVTILEGCIVNLKDTTKIALGTDGATGYNTVRAAIRFLGTEAKRIKVNGEGTGNCFKGNGTVGNYYSNGVDAYYTDFCGLDTQSELSGRDVTGEYYSYSIFDHCSFDACNTLKWNPVGITRVAFVKCRFLNSVSGENVRIWQADGESGINIILEDTVFDAGLLVSGDNLRIVNCYLIGTTTYIPKHYGVTMSGCLLCNTDVTSTNALTGMSYANSSLIMDECVLYGGIQNMTGSGAGSSVSCINSVLIGHSNTHEHFVGNCDVLLRNNVMMGTCTEACVMDFGSHGTVAAPIGVVEFNTFLTRTTDGLRVNHLGTGTTSGWEIFSNNIFTNITGSLVDDELNGSEVSVATCDNNVYYNYDDTLSPTLGTGTTTAGYTGNVAAVPGLAELSMNDFSLAMSLEMIPLVRNPRAMSRAIHQQVAAAVGGNLITPKAGCTDTTGKEMSLL